MSGTDTETGMPQVGDDTFKGPPENTLRSNLTPEQEKKVEASLAEMQDDDVKESAASKIIRPKTPEEVAEEYAAGLTKVGLKLQEARGIIENLVVHGFHEDMTRIGPLTFRYRTRGHYDTLRTYQAVESSGIAMPDAMREFISRHNTAGSLVSWGDNTFDHPVNEVEREEAFKKRFDFLTAGVSGLVAVKMMQIIHDFDIKMAAVMADGAPQDF